MVDFTNELNGQDDIWIELTESQVKFRGHKQDEVNPDPLRVTFEVHSYSQQLKPANLNLQLIPILGSHGVDSNTFSRMLVDDLTEKTARLQTSMSSGLDLRLWNQENSATPARRVEEGCVEWVGGMPRSKEEQINVLVEVRLTYCLLVSF